MDPLSALSVVAAVVQFIDFGLKVTKEFRDVYQSGSNLSQRHVDLKGFTDRTRSQLESLNSITIDPIDQSSGALNKVRQQCLSTGEDLVVIIDKIAHPKSKRRWIQTITSGSKAIWWSTDIKRIQNQLEKQIAELDSHVLTEVHKVLRQHVSKVQEHFNSLSTQQRQVAEALLRGEHHVSDLTSGIEKLSLQVRAGFSHIASSQNEYHREEFDRRLRETLSFWEMNIRQTMIRAPEEGTFDWLLEDPSVATIDGQRPVLEHPLHTWLTNQEKIYWICGKPGSGKSTLMNMICERQLHAASKLLNEWSESKEIFVASHFFWRADNSRNQVTTTGLLRTLLFRIVDEHHELTCHLRDAPDEQTTQPVWNFDRLKRAFFRILACEERPAICFIIDALDENHDDNVELLELISHISGYDRVKICLSSRPETNFARAFSDKPHLKLEQITAADIKRYVGGKIARVVPHHNDLTNLTAYISDSAQGVFIWVRCVIEGNLSKHLRTDSEQQLLDRVRRVPKDIMKLYRQMFAEMDEDDKPDVALLVQLATLSLTDKLDYPGQALHIDLPLSALTLFENELGFPLSATTKQEVLNLSNQLADTLQTRCFGLLELTPIQKQIEWCGEEVQILNQKLSFIHWTAATFIQQEFTTGAFLQIPDIELSSKLFSASCRLVYCRLEYRDSRHELDSVISEGEIDYMTSKPLLGRMFHWASLISHATAETTGATTEFSLVVEELSAMSSQVTIGRDGFVDNLLYAAIAGTTLKFCRFTFFDALCIFRCDSWERFLNLDRSNIPSDEMKEHLAFLLAVSVLQLASRPRKIWGLNTHRLWFDREKERALTLIPYWIWLEADPNAEMIRPEGTYLIDRPVSTWAFFLTWLWGLKRADAKKEDIDRIESVVLAFLEGGADVTTRTSVTFVIESNRLGGSESDEISSDGAGHGPIFTVYSEMTAKLVLSTLFETNEQISEWLNCCDTATEAGFSVKEVAKYSSNKHGSLPDLDTGSVIMRQTVFTQDQLTVLTTELLNQEHGVLHASGEVHGYISDHEPLYTTLMQITSRQEN